MAKKQLLTRIFCEDINKLFFACGILSMIIIKFFLIINIEVVCHPGDFLLFNQRDLNKNLIFYLNWLTPLIQIINILGMLSFIILLVYYLVKPVHSQLLNQYTLIISFASSIILLRLFLYIAVDMAFFTAPSRYLFPSNPLLLALLILNLYVTTKLLRSFRCSA